MIPLLLSTKPRDPTSMDSSKQANISQPQSAQMSQLPGAQQQFYPVVQQPQVVSPATSGGQTQVVITAPPAQPAIIENYKARQSKILGIIQLVAGGITFILSCVGLGLYMDWRNRFHANYMHIAGSGIWCYIFIALSGSFALSAGYKKTKGLIVAHMVLAIVASIFAFVMICASWSAVVIDVIILNDHDAYFAVYSHPDDTLPERQGYLALSTLWAMATLLVFIACIWSATLGCRVVCCTTTAVNRTTVQYISGGGQALVLDSQGRPIPGTQVVQVSGGQHMQGYTNQAMSPGAPQFAHPAQPGFNAKPGQMHLGSGYPPPY